MMLVLALLLVASTGVRARNFNITYLDVPPIVAPGQQEVDIECRYDANFTILSWYKDNNEFFSYEPDVPPRIRSFPIHGIGTVEILTCGPVDCKLRLGGLTQEATGIYRCDLERAVPPYNFANEEAHMEVHGHEPRKPLLNGLAEGYGLGDMIQAYCRGGPDSELRWYINDAEVREFRGSPTLNKTSHPIMFKGESPITEVKCAEFRYGKVYSSQKQTVKWIRKTELSKKKKNDVDNGSIVNTGRLGFLGLLLCLF